MSERTIRSRVYAVDAVAEERHGRRSGVDGAAVGGRVDALGQPAHDAKPPRAEVACKLEGILQPALRGVAAADDGDGREVQQARIAVDVQLVGRARNLPEQLGKVLVAATQQVMAGLG